MSWFFPVAVTLVLLWLGVPMVPVAIALAVFAWWFLNPNRPAWYGNPPKDLPWSEPKTPPPAERPPEQ